MNNILRKSHKNKTDSLTGAPKGVLFAMLVHERGNVLSRAYSVNG